jgi:hypothetical protein
MYPNINFVAIGSTLIGIGMLLLFEKKVQNDNQVKKDKRNDEINEIKNNEINIEKSKYYDDWHYYP